MYDHTVTRPTSRRHNASPRLTSQEMDGYAMSSVRSARSSATLSDAPSFESLPSASSRRRAGYSHLLYSLPAEKKYAAPIVVDEVSRFSSCSTSPNSSCESVNALGPSPAQGGAISPLCLSPALLATASSRSSSNRTSRSTCSRYADDHYPLITSIPAATKEPNTSVMDMAHTYNTYIRAINSCYNNASIVDDDEIPEFLFFAQTLFNVLSQQLKTDQQYLEPLLHKPIMHPRIAVRKPISIHENLVFRSSFHAWAAYVHDPATRHAFLGHEFQTHMSTFAPILVEHLHDVVYTLNTLVNDETLLPEHLNRIWSKMEDAMAAKLDLYTDAALLVGCHDRHFTINGRRAEQRSPHLPKGTTIMVKKWHSRRHEAAWKFCSSDFSGKRRLLGV